MRVLVETTPQWDPHFPAGKLVSFREIRATVRPIIWTVFAADDYAVAHPGRRRSRR